MKTLQGIFPALVTTFDAAGVFNPQAFQQLLARVYQAGVDGVYVLGSTGEGIPQSVAQRKIVTEVALEHSPKDKRIIIHVGALTTADAIELARHAEQTGAHVVSSLPPPGNYSFVEVREYYRALAAATELPMLVYFFPGASTAITTLDQLRELCALPNVIGLKFTDFDLFKLMSLKQTGATIFNGYDEVLVAGLLMGADGGIGTTYSLLPNHYVRLFAAASSGRWEEARSLQREINELVSIVVQYPVIPATKVLLRWTGIECGDCLLPRRRLSASEELQLRAQISQSRFNELFPGVK
ncbi:MAG: dihydrodipicolinate synthase family protein [Blastocatellia bacterium]